MSGNDIISGLTGGGDFGAKDDITTPAGQLRILQRAVVVDTLDNLSNRDKDQLDLLWSSIKPSQINSLEDAPRNSLVVKIVTNGLGRETSIDESLDLLFPLFSSHLSLPCKPGEQVWAIYESPESIGTAQGYWISRIVSPVDVEDANYTHYDREGNPTSPEENKQFKESADEKEEVKNPGYPNGPVFIVADKDGYTLQGADSFEKVVNNSTEKNNFVIEPVPRFTKRPGDLVIQGSNNATIILGTDRGYKETDTIDMSKSNAHSEEPLATGKGAIDIVVGRGRINVDLKSLSGDSEIDSPWPETPDGSKLTEPSKKLPTRTEPKVIMNSRLSFETDKNVSVLDDTVSNGISTPETDEAPSKKIINAPEGDPDFVNDAARMYLTMKSNPDEEFSLLKEKVPSLIEGELQPAENRASSVIKADEVRIIARSIGPDTPTLAAQFEGDNKVEDPFAGSIRIIKEGTKDKDSASIYILPDGTIQISGSKIYLGRSTSDGGEGGGPAEGSSQPYVKYQQLENIWSDLVTALEDFCNTMNTHVTPGYGAPSPQILQAVGTLMTELAPIKSNIASVKSKRIFGE